VFVDRVKIKVRGGNGGDGCIAFRREKYVPHGGPSGGDGGHGGSVILRAVTGEQSLVTPYFKPHWEAKSGEHGRGKDQYGARGKDIVLEVPLGTLVRDAETGEQLADLATEKQEFVAARGGKGGLGNIHFSTSTRQAPRISTPGEKGEERRLELELKTIADVGLVGYPNAGKSSLLAAISEAHPKIAPYPFTTLHPVVGWVAFPDYHRYSVADIPGLIDGAHQNVGLGHDFLRHIERARILVYVLDTAGVDGRQPWDDFAALKQELDLYRDGLSRRAILVVANKIDLDTAQENLEELKARVGLPVIAISALEKQGTQELVETLRERLETADAPQPES